MNYKIIQIGGKQLKIEAGKPLAVSYQGPLEPKSKISAKVLLSVEDGKVKIGQPYAGEVNLEVKEVKQGEKIRVAKFHAKANYRRVSGSRVKNTIVALT